MNWVTYMLIIIFGCMGPVVGMLVTLKMLKTGIKALVRGNVRLELERAGSMARHPAGHAATPDRVKFITAKSRRPPADIPQSRSDSKSPH